MKSETAVRVLVALPNNLGDVIMAGPVLEGLRLRYPDAGIAFLVEDGFEAGVLELPFCDEVLLFPRARIRAQLNEPCPHRGQGAVQEFVEELQEKRFDRIVNLSQAPYVAYLLSLAGIGEYAGQQFLAQGQLGVPDPWSRYLYAIPFARRYNKLHAVDVYRRIAGVRAHRGGYTIRLTTAERDDARALLARSGCGVGGNIVLLQPGAAFPSKCWPAQHCAALGKLLVAQGWDVVVSGSPGERSLCESIAQTVGGHSIAGRVSFRQALAVCSWARACVTPDTALMHGAAAFDVPVFALFGPSSPVETGPWGEGHHIFSAQGCGERPCLCSECRSQLCMKSLLPDVVYRALTGREGVTYGCDRYRTRLARDGDYSLEPCGVISSPYGEEEGAELVLRAFEVRGSGSARTGTESVVQSEWFLCRLMAMTQKLTAFLRDGNGSWVRAFEREREVCASAGGINEFWMALLNLHLNSIPLLDARAGIERSREACSELAQRIRCALGSSAGWEDGS